MLSAIKLCRGDNCSAQFLRSKLLNCLRNENNDSWLIPVLFYSLYPLQAFVNMTMNVRQELCAVMVFAVVEKAGSTVMEDKEEVCQIYLKLVSKLRFNYIKKIEFRAAFQTTVERNHESAIATLSNWFKNLAPVFEPMKIKTKTKTNRILYAWFFPRFLVHRTVCSCCDWSE